MKILILEDDERRKIKFLDKFGWDEFGEQNQVYVTDSASDCIKLLQEHEWDMLFLDHDLEGRDITSSFGPHPTGYDVAVFLESNPEFVTPVIVLHSLNYEGRRRMKHALPTAVELPWVWL